MRLGLQNGLPPPFVAALIALLSSLGGTLSPVHSQPQRQGPECHTFERMLYCPPVLSVVQGQTAEVLGMIDDLLARARG